MPSPNAAPIESGGDLVERLLTGKPLETHDLATFLILRMLRPEIEICDARFESVSQAILKDRPELRPVTDRLIVTMRLDTELFRRRLRAAGFEQTEHDILHSAIKEAQRIAGDSLTHTLGPLLEAIDLETMSQSLKTIQSMAEKQLRKDKGPR